MVGTWEVSGVFVLVFFSFFLDLIDLSFHRLSSSSPTRQ